MMDLSYQSMKIAHQAREADEMKTEMRKKNLLVLIYHHLLAQGYVSSALALEQETNGDVRRFEVCDNIDLETVLMEYECYHYVKFQKYPKFIRRAAETGENNRFVRSGGVKKSPCSAVKPLPKISSASGSQSRRGTKKRATVSQEYSSTPVNPELADFGPSVSSIRHGQAGEAVTNRKTMDSKATIQDGVKKSGIDSDHVERLLKPLGGFYGMDGDMKELAALISRDIYLDSPNVRWEDVIGLEDAKRCVKEAVVYPIKDEHSYTSGAISLLCTKLSSQLKYPELFKGVVDPWRGLLLYGPPGTGKTLLAKAVATESKTTFFNISASSIVSKWRGESEKLVRVLFQLARFYAPSTIFIDELESVVGQRGSGMGGEHEGSRRLKAELLIQMDGLARSEDLVFVLAASNLPWELDHAMLRRLEKRILVSLPSQPARQAMISHRLPPVRDTGGVVQHTALDYRLLSEETEGYSGSDIRLLCREATMRPIRKIIDTLESQRDDGETPAIRLETITTTDFLAVIAHTKPSARNLMDKYTAWELQYESV